MCFLFTFFVCKNLFIKKKKKKSEIGLMISITLLLSYYENLYGKCCYCKNLYKKCCL